jgi:hypothetical protein
MAPVLPAETTASTLRSASSCQQRLLAQGEERRLLHRHDLRGVNDFESTAEIARVGQVRLDLGGVADQNDANFRIVAHGLDGAEDDGLRRVIAAHRIKGDSHGTTLPRPLRP